MLEDAAADEVEERFEECMDEALMSSADEDGGAADADVTTVYIVGFPFDATERELENLCRN